MTRANQPKRMRQVTDETADYVCSLIRQLLSSQRQQLQVGLRGGSMHATLASPDGSISFETCKFNVERVELVLVDATQHSQAARPKRKRLPNGCDDGTPPFDPSIWGD